MLQINLLVFDGCFQTKSIEDLLQSSIDTLEQESGDWENTLEQLIYDLDKISGSSAAAIRAEVETLLERGLAATSQTMFCSVDFIGNRMRKSLIRIRADYLGEDSGLENPEPYICMLEPTAIDLSLEASQRKKLFLPDTILICRQRSIASPSRILAVSSGILQIDCPLAPITA